MRMAKERRLKPVIKLKGGGEIKDKMREEIKKVFDTGLYRLRGIGEGAFGGIKTKMNGPLRCLNTDVAKREALLEALVYNIRIYLSLFLLLSRLSLASLFNGIIRQAQRLAYKIGTASIFKPLRVSTIYLRWQPLSLRSLHIRATFPF